MLLTTAALSSVPEDITPELREAFEQTKKLDWDPDFDLDRTPADNVVAPQSTPSPKFLEGPTVYVETAGFNPAGHRRVLQALEQAGIPTVPTPTRVAVVTGSDQLISRAIVGQLDAWNNKVLMHVEDNEPLWRKMQASAPYGKKRKRGR